MVNGVGLQTFYFQSDTQKKVSKQHTLIFSSPYFTSPQRHVFVWWTFRMNPADCSLLQVAQALCLLSFVTWLQCYGFKQKFAMVHSNSTVFHLRSTLAQFHYPQGIQGVMASRATNLLAISSSLPRPLLLLFKNCVQVFEETESHGQLQPYIQLWQ